VSAALTAKGATPTVRSGNAAALMDRSFATAARAAASASATGFVAVLVPVDAHAVVSHAVIDATTTAPANR
jgi:hypothetical protein